MASAALANAELYRSVAEEKERSEAILGNIADGIVAVDRDGTIVLWNATAAQITGVPASEAVGRRVAETLQRELESGDERPAGEREVAILRGGDEVWLSLTEAVMHDDSGAVAGRVFAFRDVSAERAVETMKSEFVAAVSHELRTPLTSIYGFAETLMRQDVQFEESDRATFLGYIASESERLIRIVDDLLNVARLEAGTLGLDLGPVDVSELVAGVVKSEPRTGTGSTSTFLPGSSRRPIEDGSARSSTTSSRTPSSSRRRAGRSRSWAARAPTRSSCGSSTRARASRSPTASGSSPSSSTARRAGPTRRAARASASSSPAGSWPRCAAACGSSRRRKGSSFVFELPASNEAGPGRRG